ncbi:MAG: hypothetical protein ACOX2F_10625 [bacterium]
MIEIIEQNLLGAIENKKLAKTILFHGPSNKSILNLVCSISLQLIKPKRKFTAERFKSLCLTNSYHDFIYLSKGATGTIKIEEIHALDNIICYTPHESENRIVFIDDSASLTLQAQSALLKKIEEPPTRTYFFLSVSKKNSLLPTIVSRSVAIFIPPETMGSIETVPSDYFPFIETFTEEIGADTVAAELKKMELKLLDSNFNSLVWIDQMAENIMDIKTMSVFSNESVAKEKADYYYRMFLKMRLAFFSFFIKNDFPEVSLKIAEFLRNNQHFSFDASVFFTLIGEDFGKG